MAGKNSIQILRGSINYDPSNINGQLLDGQPFYSKKNKQLYVGDPTKEETSPVGAANLKPGNGEGSIEQITYLDTDLNAKANGIGSVALGGFRYDYAQQGKVPTDGDTTNVIDGNQSFTVGCGNYVAGDWTFVAGKDNNVYSNRAFVSGGKNVSQAIRYDGNLLEEKTNVGRFNAIFGDNNTFKSANTKRESNLIAGGSNTVNTERSIVVGYSNNVIGSYDAVFGLGNTVSANHSLIGGEKNTINGACHLAAGSNNEVSGQFNITSGQDNKNAGWYSATIGKGLIVKEGHTAQTVLGYYNDNKSDTLLEIGWGSKDAPKNIFEVYKSGIVKTQQGTLSTKEWTYDLVNNRFKNYEPMNFIVGSNNYVNGLNCFVAGHTNKIGEDMTTGEVDCDKISGGVALNYSFVNADYAFAANYGANAKYKNSAAFGLWTETGARHQTVVGVGNIGKNDTLFEVGNANTNTYGTALSGDRKNAFEILKTGGFNSYGNSTIGSNLKVKGSAFIDDYMSIGKPLEEAPAGAGNFPAYVYYKLRNGLSKTLTLYNTTSGDRRFTANTITGNINKADIVKLIIKFNTDYTPIIERGSLSKFTGLEELVLPCFYPTHDTNGNNISNKDDIYKRFESFFTTDVGTITVNNKKYYSTSEFYSLSDDALKTVYNKKIPTTLNKVTITGGDVIPAYWMYNCNNVSVIDLPNTCVDVKYHAFNFTNISKIRIPDSVQKIGWGAFYKNPNLVDVYIPDGITTLGYSMFYKDSTVAWKRIRLPKTLETIEAHAFGRIYNTELIYDGDFSNLSNIRVYCQINNNGTLVDLNYKDAREDTKEYVYLTDSEIKFIDKDGEEYGVSWNINDFKIINATNLTIDSITNMKKLIVDDVEFTSIGKSIEDMATKDQVDSANNKINVLNSGVATLNNKINTLNNKVNGIFNYDKDNGILYITLPA